ncbi:MAG TPA: hypothetical protein VN041_11335 [Microbacterium sp.]|nr:hypothetical protein [Microbacterium sp.]
MRGAWREASGWAAAVAMSTVIVGQVASTARSELLFRDGDSLIVALVARSILDHDRLDWMFSGVLFLPETAVYTVLRMLLPALSVMGVLAVNAVVNLLALYGAIRLAAGRRRPGRAPVAWSLIALGAFGMLALTETSSSRDALEPASLLLTTTYYSATVIGAVLAVGLVRRWFDARGSGSSGSSGSSSPLLSVFAPAQSRHSSGARTTSRGEDARRAPGRAALIALSGVVVVSTVTNPLFLAWATAPLLVLLLIALHPRLCGVPALRPLLVVAGGSVLGMLIRIPLSAWIADPGTGYAHPTELLRSAEYYGALAGDRLITPAGIGATALTFALLLICLLRTFRPGSRDDDSRAGGMLLAAYGWFTPLATVVGAILLGTHAARYLEPIAFAPVLGLVAHPRSIRLPSAVKVTAAIGAVLLAAGAAASVPRIHAAATAPDPDAACVVDWVNASGRTGGGQFWTVRLPKLLLKDPAQLVQVDHTLRGYNWLANRTDFAAGELTFLVEDAQTVRWQIADNPQPDAVIGCGRYRILDFASQPLKIGPQRS